VKTIEEVIGEFHAKNYTLENDLGLSCIDLPVFIDLLFNRDIRQQHDIQPYEQQQSKEYLLWRRQHEKNLRNEKKGKPTAAIDYTGYGCWRYNPIVFIKQGQAHKQRLILQDSDNRVDLDFLDPAKLRQQEGDFAILSPVTYVGRHNTAANARFLYAFAFDLDGVGVHQIHNIMRCVEDLETFPMPNIVVNSGHGLHLYFLLKQPVPMFSQNLELLNRIKKGLTDKVWNDLTSEIRDLQYQGVLQGFRMPETKTKFGEKIAAFQSNAPMYSVEELHDYIIEPKQLTAAELAQLVGDSKRSNATGVTLTEAAKRWPEWYVERVIKKLPPSGKWHVKRDVYDWWLLRLRESKNEVKVHHRYWCMLTLVIYGLKCDISREEVQADGYSLVEQFDKLTDSEDNHFTTGDVDDAMKGYAYGYNTWPIVEIEKTTGLLFQRNRRNGRDKWTHLKRIRAMEEVDYPDGSWRKGNGRKKGSVVSSEDSRCAQIVRKWREENPDSNNKSACARDTGLTRPTVRKWWIETNRENCIFALTIKN
jgi:hypothetical protein